MVRHGSRLAALLVAASLLVPASATYAATGRHGVTLVSGGSCLLQNAGSPDSFPGNAEVQQAADPSNPSYVYEVWIGCNGIGFARSTDGGRTFSAPVAIPGSDSGPQSWDPSIAVSPLDGAVYVGFIQDAASGGSSCCWSSGLPASIPFVSTSTDHGLSFSEAVAVIPPPPAPSTSPPPGDQVFSDRDFIAVSPVDGAVYVTWDYNVYATTAALACSFSCWYSQGYYNVVISKSTDGGAAWSTPSPINPDYPYGGAIAAPLVVGANGQVYVLYDEYGHSGPTLTPGYEYFASSTDGGATWSSRVALTGADGTQTAPTEWWIDGALSLGADGVLYASYDTQGGSQDNAWVTYSRDGGGRWSTPTLVGGEASGGELHIEVTVSALPHRSAYLAWYVITSSGAWRVYASSLKIDMFSKPAALSAPLQLSPRRRGVGITGVWGGDTIGLSVVGDRALVSWGYGVMVSGFPFPISEIYATRFSLL